MERSRAMENMEIGNGTVPNNRKYGNREWNGPEQWKIWKSGFEQSRTMKKWDTGMEGSRTMEKMGYGNGRVRNNGKNGIREWNGPEQ